MRFDLKILSIPALALGLLVLLITVALRQFAIDLAAVEAIETRKLQYLANNAVETLLNKRLNRVDSLAHSAALEQLVLAGNTTEIADSLKSWKKSLELPVLAYFDPESNTLHLPETAARSGESYGISDRITEQLSINKLKPQVSFSMFRGQPSWLKCSAITIAGEARGLFISGVRLDQGLVKEIANFTGNIVTVNTPPAQSRWLQITAESRLFRLKASHKTLKSSSGAVGFWFFIYSFQTSSVTFPLEATQ